MRRLTNLSPLAVCLAASVALAACGTSTFSEQDQVNACIELMDDNAPSGGIENPTFAVDKIEDISTITINATLDRNDAWPEGTAAQVTCVFRGAKRMHFQWDQPKGQALLK